MQNLPDQKPQQQLTPAKQFEGLIAQNIKQIKSLLPEGVSVERFARVTMMAVTANNALLLCDRQTLFNEALKCASDGLVPDGREAALVPFRGTVKYMPMIGGISKRILQAGFVKSFTVEVVREGDEYESWTDEHGQHFKFKKAMKNRGETMLTFSCVWTISGGFFFCEMSEDEMQQVRNMVRAKNSPWDTWPDEMRKKTCLRRGLKYLPAGADLQLADIFDRDNDFYEFDDRQPSKTEDEKREEVRQVQAAKHAELEEKEALISQIEQHGEKINSGKSLNEKALWMINNLKVTSYKELKAMTNSDLVTLLDTIKTIDIASKVVIKNEFDSENMNFSDDSDISTDDLLKSMEGQAIKSGGDHGQQQQK
jgi:phage RecT family recombinase